MKINKNTVTISQLIKCFLSVLALVAIMASASNIDVTSASSSISVQSHTASSNIFVQPTLP